ncbi:MAG: hypothetical protein AB7F99_06150 [Vicinamibacterales bacterium]
MESLGPRQRVAARNVLLADDRATMAVALVLFLVAASFSLAKTGRDALFFLQDGIFDLPFAYVGIAALSLPVAVATLSLMRRAGSRRVRVALHLAAAAGLMGYSAVVRPGGGPLMTALFMGVPLVYNVLFALVWLLGADLVGGRPELTQRRFYSRTGAASLAGSFAGALGARTMTPAIAAPQLLAVAGVLLVSAGLVAAAAQRLCPPMPAVPPVAPMVRHTARSLMQISYFWRLLAVAVAAALTGILVEFQFYVAASSGGRSASDNVVLFANLYLGLAALAVIVQLFVTPALHERIGVGGTLLVLPAAVAVLTPLTIANPSLGLRSVLRLTEGGLKSSVHRVSWERTFVGFASRQRAAARLLIDGSAPRIAEGVAAVGLYVWLSAQERVSNALPDGGWLGYLLLAVSASWIVLTVAMGADAKTVGPKTVPGNRTQDSPRHGPDCCPIVTELGARVQAAEHGKL